MSGKKVGRFLCVVPFVALAGAAAAQGFPNKPIRMVAAAAGGGGDQVARLIAPGLTKNLGQPIIIDNRGGEATIPNVIVAKSAPDGYTLLVSGGALWLLPLLQEVAYDPIKDFAPVTLGLVQPLLMAVHPSVPANSVKEFVALAKARPGALNYSSGIGGSGPHLGGELFKAMAGVNLVRVPYKGGTQALQGIVAGETQVIFATTTQAVPQIKAGKLRALGVTTAQPSALFPDLPTVASQGVPGFELTASNGVFAPGRTPAALVNQLNAEINKVLQTPEIRNRFLSVGTEVVNSSPEQAAAAIRADMARLGKVIKEAGIKAE